MKKSILIGALVALMLFAFVACDNSTPVNRTIEGLEVTTSRTDYLVNQYFDPSTITVLVRYTDGTTVPVDASISVEGATNGKLATAQQYKVVATYGYIVTDGYFGQNASTEQVSSSTTISAYSIDRIDVTKLPETVSYEEETAAADINLSGIEVTATYNGSSKMVLAEGEYKVSASQGAIPAYVTDGDNKTKISVSETLSATGNKDAEFEVSVTEKAPAAEKPLTGPVTSITVTEGENFPEKIFYHDSVSDVEANLVVKASDGTNTITLDRSQYTITWGEGVTNRQFVVAGTSDETTGADVSYYVTYNADPTVAAVTDKVSVLNYVTSLSFTPATIEGVTKGVAATDSTTRGKVTVAGVLAYDSNPSDDSPATISSLSTWNFRNPVLTLNSEPVVYKNAKGEIVTGNLGVTYTE